jgi:DNA-binding transcriptional regulator GbsR (MarR family)
VERARAIFVDGIGTAAATSGILSQLQGRIFALLYLEPGPLSLDQVATELQQSKSNVSVNIRGLVDWHLVRRVQVGGSRKDHYEAATDFWRAMQEIMERRFRWNLRQIIATSEETERALKAGRRGGGKERAFLESRLRAMHSFASAVDAGIGAFSQGESFEPQRVQSVLQSIPIRSSWR